jgi:hypothetical protein
MIITLLNKVVRLKLEGKIKSTSVLWRSCGMCYYHPRLAPCQLSLQKERKGMSGESQLDMAFHTQRALQQLETVEFFQRRG